MENLYGRLYAEKQLRITPNPIMSKVTEMPIFSGERVLEIGATNTDVINHVKNQGGVYIGIDINKAAIDRVLRKMPGEQLLVADARKLPFGDETFEKIISIHTLEHIRYLSEALAEMFRVTKKGGQNIHIFPADLLLKEESSIADAFRVHPFNPVKAVRLASELHQYKLDREEIGKNMASAPFDIVSMNRFFVQPFPIPKWNNVLRLYK